MKTRRSPKLSPKRSPKRNPKLSPKRSPKRSARKKSVCWKGYHRVKATVAYSKGSCVKNKR